jgi:hypothetical protein
MFKCVLMISFVECESYSNELYRALQENDGRILGVTLIDLARMSESVYCIVVKICDNVVNKSLRIFRKH